MNELSLVLEQLKEARCPEDIFGAHVKTAYHALLRVVHPDRNDNDPLATKATEKLNELKAAADERLKQGTWGQRLPLPAYELIDVGTYKVDRKPIIGDVCDVYRSNNDVVKVVRSMDDNDLMRAERSALATLASKMAATSVSAGVPKLVDTFQIGRREVNVLERMPEGFVTAQEVHARMPAGVDGRTLVWMFKRLLVVLEWAHHCGIVHGAVLPQHVMFHPDNAAAKAGHFGHTVRLLDWCYSVEYAKRTRLSSWVPAWEAYYPPELVLKKSVSPASDLHMAANLMVYLDGSYELAGPLFDVLKKCLMKDATKRYQKVGEVFDDWVAAAKKVYGPPKWVNFELPK